MDNLVETEKVQFRYSDTFAMPRSYGNILEHLRAVEKIVQTRIEKRGLPPEMLRPVCFVYYIDEPAPSSSLPQEIRAVRIIPQFRPTPRMHLQDPVT